MSAHIKTPLAQSLPRVASAKVADAMALSGKSLPCTVKTVVSSGIVKVTFAVDAAPWTLPEITVPVLAFEWVRYPIQVGTPGVVYSSDARLGGITGLGAGTPRLGDQPANLAALAFAPLGNTAWSDPLDPNATEIYGVDDSGVILRNGNSTVKLTLDDAGILIDLNGSGGITINTGGFDVVLNGGGNVTVNDGGDVVAGSISLLNHTHGGVTTGSDDTTGPL